MDKKDKERFKKILLQKKEEIISKIVEFDSESKEIEPEVAQDLADRADNTYTKEFLLSLSTQERKQLKLIDQALSRLEEGTYGRCEMCGEKISKKRLEAIPWTPYCVRCQEKAEERTEPEPF